MDDLRRILALILLVFTPPSILFWFFVHPLIRLWRRLGAGWSYAVVGALCVPIMLGIYAAAGRLLVVEYGTHYPLPALGLLFIAVSAWMRRMIQKRLTNRILMGVPELSPSREAVPLITEGPHGIIRHPRYVQFLLGLLGWSLVVNYLAVYLLFLLSIPALLLVVALEERELRERYGAVWDDYARRVPKFLPKVGRR